ncbi:hypothetical protein J31TS4_01160 [Paenibacillus sp. J31TS4]|uniref:hypothetical protein n=1 Tax=Paenibacillus sp. J31TS4 TaxID=2807195 RepID=UPI001B2E4BB3|nr:hypothetical protein [Paenibacillus sp. J31TS4]GIP36836.1 hypothetical protein J31TS4_01160 [Paenibacillus sp. J31TS4]
MIGTWRWNAAIGGLGFLLTFAASVGNNVFLTTLTHSLYSFAVLFAAAYLFRWALGSFVPSLGKQASPQGGVESAAPSHLGRSIDLQTPDESAPHSGADTQSLDEADASFVGSPQDGGPPPGQREQFAPLTPPRLLTKQKLEPDELAKAVRHLSEE